MRAVLILSIFALIAPASGWAQTATSPSADTRSAASARGGDISRDEYITRAVERARRSAATRFDRMDTDHDGVLTADERRAARAERADRAAKRRAAASQ